MQDIGIIIPFPNEYDKSKLRFKVLRIFKTCVSEQSYSRAVQL